VRPEWESSRGPGGYVGDAARADLVAIAHPKLGARLAVLGAEEDPPTDGGERFGKCTVLTGNDIAHHVRAVLGAVAHPQLVAVLAVFGGKKERARDVGEEAWQ